MNKINKVILAMVCIVVILGAIITAVMLFNKKDNEPEAKVEEKVAEEILDDCTDEYEEIQENEAIITNSDNEKISPNCRITFKKYYNKCKDTINEYKTVPQNLVNKTKEELQEEYNDWEIRNFSENEIELYKEYDGECNEHYILKDNNGKISIYKYSENGEEELYENTEIATDYLTPTDKINIKNGLKVNGKEELNEVIESFE